MRSPLLLAGAVLAAVFVSCTPATAFAGGVHGPETRSLVSVSQEDTCPGECARWSDDTQEQHHHSRGGLLLNARTVAGAAMAAAGLGLAAFAVRRWMSRQA